MHITNACSWTSIPLRARFAADVGRYVALTNPRVEEKVNE